VFDPRGLLVSARASRHVFPNGFTLLVREDRAAPVVALVTRVKAGYFNEPDTQVGISHVLEHMYFKGTPTRGPGEIATATKEVGGWLNAHTIYDATTYITVLPRSNWQGALDIQYDAFANSLIDADELRRELEVIIQEAARKADTPSAVTAETLYELLHDTHRMRRWRIGREAGLRTFTHAMVHGFYRNWYTPSNSILAVVGDVDADEVVAAVAARYGSLPTRDPMPDHGSTETGWSGARYRALTGDVTQSHLSFGWRTVGPLHPDAPALDVAAALLSTGRSSRLYRTVRDSGLAVSASAYHYTPTQLGVFVIGIVGQDNTLPTAAATAWQELRRLAADGPTDDELQRTRHVIRTRRLRSAESMEGQANEMVAWEALGGADVGEAYWHAVDTVSASEIQRVLSQRLRDDAVAVVSYRPTGSTQIAATGGALVREWNTFVAPPLAAEVRVPPIPVTPVPTPVFDGRVGAVHVFRTANGMPILVRRKPGAQLTHLGAFIAGGAVSEPIGAAGLTSLLVRSSIKATHTRTASALAEEAERLGGSISPSASKELFGWQISVPNSAAAAAAVLLADVVEEASFPATVVEAELAQMRSELRARNDDMVRHPLALARRLLFGSHTYGVDALGTSEDHDRLSTEMVAQWHQTAVLNGRQVLAIVGDGDPAELAATVSSAFATMRCGETSQVDTIPQVQSIVELVEVRQKQQSAVAMLFPGPARSDAACFPLSLMTGIASGLGGRFFESLRSKQSLAYSVFVSATSLRNAGMISSYIACAPSRETEARAGLLREFSTLAEAPVTQAEVERARTYALGMHALRQESAGAQLSDLVDAWCLGDGLHELEEEEDRLRAVTVEQIRDATARWCDPTRRVDVVIRGVAE
jgi:zinc protease